MRAYPENNTSATLLAAIAAEGTNETERTALRDALVASIDTSAKPADVVAARDVTLIELASATAPLTDINVGLSAIKAAVAAIPTTGNLLTDGTIGLAALQELVAGISGVAPRTIVMMTEDAVGTVPAGYKRYSGNTPGISQTPIKIELAPALSVAGSSVELNFCAGRFYSLPQNGVNTGSYYDASNYSLALWQAVSVPVNTLGAGVTSGAFTGATSGYVYAAGGNSGSVGLRRLTPASNSWSSMANIPTQRVGGVLIGSPIEEVLFAFGGATSGGVENLTIDKYIEASNTWVAAVATFPAGITTARPIVAKTGAGNLLISFSASQNYLFNVTTYALTPVDAFPGARPAIAQIVPVRTTTGCALVLAGASVTSGGKRCAVFTEGAVTGSQWSDVESHIVGFSTGTSGVQAYSVQLADGSTYVNVNSGGNTGMTAYQQYDISGRTSYFEKL